MAVFAGFWIAITITNGWPAIYAIASGVSLALFAFGVGALWVGSGPRPEPQSKFAGTLEEEVRRNLALVDDQLSVTRHWMLYILGAASIVVGSMLFSWTINRSQDIPDSSSSGWFPIVLVFWCGWAFFKARDAMRKEKPKLELRQRRLRELLASLDARE